MKEIKVGIIGSGSIATHKHLPGHLKVEGVSVIAACDIDLQRAQNFADEHEIEYVFDSHHDLLTMPEIDAVSVCTPNNFHAEPTIAALKANKHVICEKPIAGNAVDGQAMVDAQKVSGKILQIGLQSRFGTEARTLRRLYEDGLFGHIYYARAMTIRRRGMGLVPTFMQKSISGGGPLIDIGVHELDVLLWMIGYPKPVEAFGYATRKFGHRHDIVHDGDWDRSKFDVEDFAVGVIRFENDLTVNLETAWACHYQGMGGSFFMGDLAGASYHPMRIYTDQDGEMIDYEPKPVTGFSGEFESFHQAIRQDLPSPVPAEEVLMTAKIFDAIYESSRIGRSVPIA
jgi:predicted dehydrogenase